jgi:hypothetical protein
MIDLSILLQMAAMGEKLVGDLWIGQSMSCRLGQEPFSESSRIHPILLGQRERLSRTACHDRICVVCIR